MPYITHSKNSPELLDQCLAVGRLFTSTTVQRRGKKPIDKVVADARAHGFKNVVLLGRDDGGAIEASIIKTSRAGTEHSVSARYIIKKAGTGIQIKEKKENGKSGTGDGKKSIIAEAED